MFLIINSLLQSVQVNTPNIETRNFVSILPYSISTFRLKISVEAMSHATQIHQYRSMDFALGDDPCVVLDQYLGGKGLEELIFKEGNVSNNDLQ